MRIFFSVGEPSGDLHGANLIAELRRHDPELAAAGFGGPRMAGSGCVLLYDLTSLAVMGLWQVLLNYFRFRRLLAMADRYFAGHQVDAVVLVDFPGFNWHIARRARRHGIPVFYYGVPQMWAWAPWRVRKLRRLVDVVLCKLPFEESWFRQRGVDARFVGHPYFDELCTYRPDREFQTDYDDHDSRLLVLLPGSRTQEIERNLPDMLQAARLVQQRHSDTAVAVACLNSRHAERARELCRAGSFPFDVMSGRTPELIELSTACLACSGSVSLELLYHRKPAVIVYRVGWLARLFGWMVLRTRFITLVNLLSVESIERGNSPSYDPDDAANTRVLFPEYLTVQNCSDRLAAWIIRWLDDSAALEQRQRQLDELAGRLVVTGASRRAARLILQELRGELAAMPAAGAIGDAMVPGGAADRTGAAPSGPDWRERKAA